MHIRDTRKCNLWNLEALAEFLGADADVLRGYYQELLDDERFIASLNERMRAVRRDHGFTKGIFAKPRVPSVDWFAFERVLLYVLVRHLEPRVCLETGVYYGGNTAFLLAGLARNGVGRLISIDYPDGLIREAEAFDRHPGVGDTELYDGALAPGFIIPDYLKGPWDLRIGDSHAVIPTLDETFDLYVHDSEHSFGFASKEMELAAARLSPGGVAVVDDIDWSNAFFAFCVGRRLRPLCVTDNGKGNLRMRTGIVKLDHPDNRVPEITGGP